MRARLPREESSRNRPARQLRRSGSRCVVGAFGCPTTRKTLCFARRGSENRKLRDALCIRAAPRIPNRRLDRARFEAELLAGSKENDSAAAARIFRNLFWGAWRVRAAVFVSSCKDGFARVRGIERFLDSASPRSE